MQLLQRICSLMPAIREEMLKQRRGEQIVKIIARAEQQAALPTYINLTEEQIGFELQTDFLNGLSAAEVQSRLDHYGGNLLQRSRRDPWHFKLLRNLFSFFAILLWIAALLCFVPGVDLPQLGIAILTVILVNGLFAFLQEYKSDRALEMLQQLIAQKSKVIRDGATQEIAAAELVPGDVIVLEEGDLVPADCRITEAFEVEVDNSSLTGEATPARRYKSDQPVLIPGKFLWIELPNILFAGTSLLRGRTCAVVFGTGMACGRLHPGARHLWATWASPARRPRHCRTPVGSCGSRWDSQTTSDQPRFGFIPNPHPLPPLPSCEAQRRR